MKSHNKSGKGNASLTLDDTIKQFFPKTSKMGVGVVTPWEKQPPIKRKSGKGEPQPPRLRLPRVAISTPF